MWGFWTLDPERDGKRLRLIVELAGDGSAGALALLRAVEAHEPPLRVPARSGERVRAPRARAARS